MVAHKSASPACGLLIGFYFSTFFYGVFTSVARLWLAPLARRNLTTLSWFSWAAMYRGVKPFWLWTLTEALWCTRIFTTSSWPAANFEWHSLRLFASGKIFFRSYRGRRCEGLCSPSWWLHPQWLLCSTVQSLHVRGRPWRLSGGRSVHSADTKNTKVRKCYWVT